MYELVKLKNNEPITTSEIIANGTQNKHSSIQAIIDKYSNEIQEFGSLRFEIEVRNREVGATRKKIYYLNEEQATFVITLLRNSKTVVKFKKELVLQFFHMRNYIYEKQTKEWEMARLDNKSTRLKETDVIKELIKYAKEQGSEHSERLYLIYSKLAKEVVGGNRENLSFRELSTLTMVESIILRTIRDGMAMNKHYKIIYKDCKERIEKFAEVTYLTKAI